MLRQISYYSLKRIVIKSTGNLLTPASELWGMEVGAYKLVFVRSD
jgi:hypothetical protein